MEPQVHNANAAKSRRTKRRPKSQHSRPVTLGRFEFRDRLSLGNVEQPQWLVGYLLRRNSYALLYAKPETFKSLFALDMAMSIGAQRPDCLGLPIKAEHGAALYIGGEDLQDFGRRVRAWEAAHDGTEATGFHHVFQVPQPGEMPKFIEHVREAAGRGRFDIIICDTVIDGMAGLNEDSARDMALFNAGMMQLGKELGGTVLAIHHSGKANYRGERGSSALRGKVRTAIKMERKGDTATVKIDKQNSGERTTEFAVDLHKVPSSVSGEWDVTLKRCDTPVTGEKASRALKEARNYDASISSVLDKVPRKDGGYKQKEIAEYLAGTVEKIEKPGEYISVNMFTKGGWLKELSAAKSKTAKHYANGQWRG